MNMNEKKNHYFRARNILVLLIIPALLGCAGMRTEYKRPEVALPETWQAQHATGEAAIAAGKWWEVFQDPDLNGLIEKVLQTNNNLAVAAIKVRKARLQAGLSATELWSDISMNANAGLQKNFDGGGTVKSSGVSASLSYEADLWGKLDASRDAADWEARATEQDRANTALTLVGTTADLYWQIAYLNQAISTRREGIAYTLKTLELVRVKYDAGAVSKLDLLQAEQDVETQKSELAGLEQQLVEARNAFAVLFDQAPEHVMADPKQLSDMELPALEAGIPAAVLGNRPDLKAAEMRLRGILADVDSTRASYYPGLSLTSKLGTSSTELINFLKNPVAALGVDLTFPFVQRNKSKLNIQMAEADYDQAVVEFRQTLYKALQDVENSLSARNSYLTQEGTLRHSDELAKEAENLAEIRYRSGATGIQTWLDQQEKLRSSELSIAQNRYNQLTNLMTLYQALGGGQSIIKSSDKALSMDTRR
jgi:NodT family efflux transporter outer membrane factor (OMF) lipoprotein